MNRKLRESILKAKNAAANEMRRVKEKYGCETIEQVYIKMRLIKHIKCFGVNITDDELKTKSIADLRNYVISLAIDDLD